MVHEWHNNRWKWMSNPAHSAGFRLELCYVLLVSLIYVEKYTTYVPLNHLANRRDHSFVTRSRHESPRSVEIVVIRSLHCLIWPRSGRVLPPKKPTICNRFLVMNQQKYGTNNHWEANSCGRTLKKCFSCSKKQDPFRALQHDLNLLICSGWDGVPRRRFDDVFGEGIVFFLPVFTWAMTKNLGCLGVLGDLTSYPVMWGL